MYAISRRDLPIAQQAIQAGHAAAEHAYSHGRPPDHHPSLIFLTTRDKESLSNLQQTLHAKGFNTSEFYEPYRDWGLTAISCLLKEEDRAILADLKMWRAGS